MRALPAAGVHELKPLVHDLLTRYRSPGQAYWRALELVALRRAAPREPVPGYVVEVGPGDAGFSADAVGKVHVAVDWNIRALRRDRTRAASDWQVVADARLLALADGTATLVFANSVLEHIEGLHRALAEIARVLRPGGRLLCTVPLAEMNRWLLSGRSGYVNWRQSGLHHRNLLEAAEWELAFHQAGLSLVTSAGYLSGPECRLWDKLDAWGCVGVGRLRAGLLARSVLNAPDVARALAARLSRLHSELPDDGSRCAAVFIAERGA